MVVSTESTSKQIGRCPLSQHDDEMVGDDYLNNDDEDFIDECRGNEDEDENLQKEKMMKNKDDIENTCIKNCVQTLIVR